jgi:hypothetical protein
MTDDFPLIALFGMSFTGVERRYASNSGHAQNSVCISSTPSNN